MLEWTWGSDKMKQKTITCPFCNQETIAYEGILFSCTKCNEPIILEVSKSKKVEDNLYFNQDNNKEVLLWSRSVVSDSLGPHGL